MLHALNHIASSAKTKATLQAVKHFLDYAATNPNAKIKYRASNMILQGDSDAAYLVAPEARSRAGGFHFTGNEDGQLTNGPITVLAKIIKHVMKSAAEAEVIALYMNAEELVPLRHCLEEMGHPQPPTPLKTDNSTANGIVNRTMKQKRSKSFDMRYQWMRNRVDQGQFKVYWQPGSQNKGDFSTKHHTGTHHRIFRKIQLYEGDESPTSEQGCIELLKLKKIQTEKSTTNKYKYTLRDCNTQEVINNHGTTRALRVQTRNTSTPQNTSTPSILNKQPRSKSALNNTGQRVTWGTDIPQNNTKTKFLQLMSTRKTHPRKLQRWLSAVNSAADRILTINRNTHKSSRTLF